MRGLLLLVTCFLSLFHTLNGARFNVMGSFNQEQRIRLKSQYDLEPGSILILPVDIPEETISVNGKLAPRLLRIESSSGNGLYGPGDTIRLEFVYSAPVGVQGSPTLTLNTGCHDPSCTIKEVQQFTCKADLGMFGLRIDDNFLMNIAVNTTQQAFKFQLEELEGINEVTVWYSESDDREVSGDSRICTQVGNVVNVVFEDVSFPQYNNDVPQMQFDIFNQFADVRTGLVLGAFATSLSMLTTPPYPSVTGQTITNGFKKRRWDRDLRRWQWHRHASIRIFDCGW